MPEPRWRSICQHNRSRSANSPAPACRIAYRRRTATAGTEQPSGELRGQLTADDNLRVQQRDLLDKITRHQQDVTDRSRLNQLIGSADGAKFSRFAQGLTLDYLIHLANRRLEKLHGRYVLQRKTADSTELQITDTAGRHSA